MTRSDIWRVIGKWKLRVRSQAIDGGRCYSVLEHECSLHDYLLIFICCSFAEFIEFVYVLRGAYVQCMN